MLTNFYVHVTFLAANFLHILFYLKCSLLYLYVLKTTDSFKQKKPL